MGGTLTSAALSGAAHRCFHDDAIHDMETAWDTTTTRRLSPTGRRFVGAGRFYAEFHGHPIEDLVEIRRALVEQGCRQFIYLLGDSSLDNKHWSFSAAAPKESQLFDKGFTALAVNGYEGVLSPARMVKDVCYWMNAKAAERLGAANKVCTVMTAVEASTIADREAMRGGLLKQEAFVRDHLTSDDFLVVSVGGNDIALRPTPRTILNLLLVTRSPEWLIRSGWAPGFGYLVRLFRDRVAATVRRVTAKAKPKKVLVCTIYFPAENSPSASWADFALEKLGYNANPSKLQLLIECVHERIEALGGYDVPGTTVVPLPLFRVLDGKDPSDYEQRVEPSVSGGEKMADAFLEEILLDVRA